MNSVSIKEDTLDGRRIAYSNETKFLIQVGKGSKGAYKTRYTVIGNLAQALIYYTGIYNHSGYKKRLYVPSMNKPVLARVL